MKLRNATKAQKIGDEELAHQMEVSRQMVTAWKQKEGKVPDGIYMIWLSQILKISPMELVGGAALTPKGGGFESQGAPSAQLAVLEGSNARWLLNALEGLVGDFRRHLEREEAAARATGAAADIRDAGSAFDEGKEGQA